MAVLCSLLTFFAIVADITAIKSKASSEATPQQDDSFDLVSMPAFLHTADIADSSWASCQGNVTDAREAARKLLSAGKPQLVAFQRPCKPQGLPDFLDELQKHKGSVPSWVLLWVDGDPPLTAADQQHILDVGKPLGLKKVFATNLGAGTPDPNFFIPQPQGMCYHCDQGNYEEDLINSAPPGVVAIKSRDTIHAHSNMDMIASRVSAIKRAKKMSKPFQARQAKVWIGDWKDSDPSRVVFKNLLSKPEYADLVHVHDGGRLAIDDYLAEIAQYKALLSPPGAGYDCYRHWEGLAVGTVPLVLRSEAYKEDMDMRLWEGTGAHFLPSESSELTPSKLKELLDSLEDPSDHYQVVTTAYWEEKWRAPLNS